MSRNDDRALLPARIVDTPTHFVALTTDSHLVHVLMPVADAPDMVVA
jgi:hypothetical protein